MIQTCGDVQSRTDLVAAFDVRGERAERRVDDGRADRGHLPFTEDSFGSHQVVRVGVLDVAAKRGLGERAIVAVADRASRRRVRDERTASGRCPDQQAGERVHAQAAGNLAAGIVVGE